MNHSDFNLNAEQQSFFSRKDTGDSRLVQYNTTYEATTEELKQMEERMINTFSLTAAEKPKLWHFVIARDAVERIRS